MYLARARLVGGGWIGSSSSGIGNCGSMSDKLLNRLTELVVVVVVAGGVGRTAMDELADAKLDRFPRDFW